MSYAQIRLKVVFNRAVVLAKAQRTQRDSVFVVGEIISRHKYSFAHFARANICIITECPKIQAEYDTVSLIESTGLQINILIKCISPGNESQLRILPAVGDIWRK